MEIYGIACLVVALLGRRARAGFVGVLLLSVVFTPVVVGFALIALSTSRKRAPLSTET